MGQKSAYFLIVLALIVIIINEHAVIARKFPYPIESNHATKSIYRNDQFRNNEDKPLILTPILNDGNVTYAQSLSKVSHPDFIGVESYSGYFTVNESCGSNLFFWFFPAQKDPENAPVLLWLQGGPGGSSLFAAMFENGPLRLFANGDIQKANYSWNENHNLVYIDNPAGVGYSFTGRKDCLATEETQIGKELHEALKQFFQLFPNLQSNEFFLTGESYAGKYIPITAYTIHKKNPTSEVKINLKGLIIGDGDIDMVNQRRYSPYLYELGLIDDDGRKQFEELEDQLVAAIEAKNWELAVNLDMMMLDGGEGSLYYNLTGLASYYSYVSEDNLSFDAIMTLLNRADIKKALHTGDVEYLVQSQDVSQSMHSDFTKSVAPELVEILNNDYRVLLYSGQLDVCVAYPLTRNFVNKLQFNGKTEFHSAQRFIWQVDEKVAGYVREGGHLTLALVRNAGHMVPAEQPKWMMDLLLGFIQPKCVVFKDNRRMLDTSCVQ